LSQVQFAPLAIYPTAPQVQVKVLVTPVVPAVIPRPQTQVPAALFVDPVGQAPQLIGLV